MGISLGILPLGWTGRMKKNNNGAKRCWMSKPKNITPKNTHLHMFFWFLQTNQQSFQSMSQQNKTCDKGSSWNHQTIGWCSAKNPPLKKFIANPTDLPGHFVCFFLFFSNPFYHSNRVGGWSLGPGNIWNKVNKVRINNDDLNKNWWRFVPNARQLTSNGGTNIWKLNKKERILCNMIVALTPIVSNIGPAHWMKCQQTRHEFGKQTKFPQQRTYRWYYAKHGHLDKLWLIIALDSPGQNASMVVSDNSDGSEEKQKKLIARGKRNIKSNHLSFWSVCVS